MKYCPTCGAEVDDSAALCPQCGALFANYAQPAPAYAYDPTDHTAEFSAKDISDAKLPSALAYLLGPVGIIIALLLEPNSTCVRFHVREAIKLTICEILCGLITALLSWTIVVAIVGGIALMVLMVVQLICVIRVLRNKVTEAPIINKFTFLK